VAEFLNPATASAESPRQEVLRHALFPPPFNEQRDELDGYIQRGLQLAADAEQALL
jgi:hypothetical protein